MGTLPWFLATVLLLGVSAAAVEVADREDDHDLVDRLFPIELGNSWVYETERDGEPSGLRVSQIVGTGLLAGSELGAGATEEATADGYILRSHFENHIGTGSPLTRLEYVRRDGDRVVALGQRDNGGMFATHEPPFPIVDGGLSVGATRRFDGLVAGEEGVAEIEMMGFAQVEAGGTTYEGCAHIRTAFTFPQQNGDPLRSTSDEWTCPGVGRVKSIEVSEDGTFSYSEELIDHSLDGSLDTNDALLPPLDASESFTGGVSGGGARANHSNGELDLDRLAYSHTSSASTLFPPVGNGEVNVLAEEDGNVTATDPRTGDHLWRLRLAGPIVAPVELGGGGAFIADKEKRLFAVGLQDGIVRWRASFDDVVTAAPVIADGTVVVATEDGSIHSLDIRTGEELWKAERGGTIQGAPATDEGLVVFADTSDGIVAYDAADGSTLWVHEPEDVATSGPVIAGDRVIFGDGVGAVQAVSLETGEEEWSRPLAAYSLLSVPVAADEASAYFVIETGAGRVLLQSVSLADGDLRWTTEIGEGVDHAPAVVGDRVVVVTESGTVAAFDSANGSRAQERALPALEDGVEVGAGMGPALQGGVLTASVTTDLPYLQTTYFSFFLDGQGEGEIIEAGSRSITETPAAGPVLVGSDVIYPTYGGGIVAVDPAGRTRTLAETAETATYLHRADRFLIAPDEKGVVAVEPGGGVAWRFPSGEGSGGETVDHAGGRVFVPVTGQALAAVDEATGEPRWLHTATGNGIGTPLSLPDGDVVYGVGELARLDGATGKVEWSVPDLVTLNPTAGGGEDPLIVMGFDFAADEIALIGIDPDTGDELWRAPIETPLFVGPAVDSGIAVAPSARGVLTAHVASTGEEIWKVRLQTPLAASPVVADGRVYLLEGGRIEDLVAREFRLRVLDARTGSLRASYEGSGASSRTGDVTVGRDGEVVMSSAFQLLLLEAGDW